MEVGIALVEAFRLASPSSFAWREPPYEYEPTLMPIDILFGSSALRDGFEQGRTTADIVAAWRDDVGAFMTVRDKFLLY